MFQIAFVTGAIIILNRQLFQWNANSFCRKFRSSLVATEFIIVFKREAKYDLVKRYYTFNEDEEAPDAELPDGEAEENYDRTSQTSLNPSQGGRSSPAGTPTSAQKRSLPTESSSTPPAKRAADGTIHSDPLDDSILSKRVGMFNTNVESVAWLFRSLLA